MTTRITSLTAAQKARFAEFRDKWIEIGLSTEPADRVEAERGIKESYCVAGLKEPERIVWCGSPLSQGLTRAIIINKQLAKKVGENVARSVWLNIAESTKERGKKIVRRNVREDVWSGIVAGVDASVWGNVAVSVRESVGPSAWRSRWAGVGPNMIGTNVLESVWTSVGASVRESIGWNVEESVRDNVALNVAASTRGSPWETVWQDIRAIFGVDVGSTIGASVWASVWASAYGQHDAGWLAGNDYFRSVCGLKAETKPLRGIMAVARSANWWLPHENICWVSERPQILTRDDCGRLHNLSGPALIYPDGWAIYAVHGLRVPEWIIENHTIKVR